MRGFSAAIAFSVVLHLCHPLSLNADIIGQSSSINLSANPPADIRQGIIENDQSILAFIERQDFSLLQELAVDLSLPGTYPVGSDPGFTPITVAAGTRVDSYYAHFDPVGQPPNGNAVFISGFLTFDRDVLGIITKNGTLLDGNTVIGSPSVQYPTGNFQGVELFDAGSFVTLSDDRRTVSFGLPVGPHADNLRIITAAVPEASTLILLSSAVACVMVWNWRCGRQIAHR